MVAGEDDLDIVFPAYAGMDRVTCALDLFGIRVPRLRGDGPDTPSSTCSRESCSPPTRGWTVAAPGPGRDDGVFPAYAGMDRLRPERKAGGSGVPRLRGDGPLQEKLEKLKLECSPPTRGWTALVPQPLVDSLVFPALPTSTCPADRGCEGAKTRRGGGSSSPSQTGPGSSPFPSCLLSDIAPQTPSPEPAVPISPISPQATFLEPFLYSFREDFFFETKNTFRADLL